MRALLVLLLLSTVALAGCTDGDDTEPVTSAECLEQGLILGEDAEGNPVCVEPPFVIEEFEDSNHHCVVNEQRDRLHAPDLIGDPWTIGQYWDYSLEVDGNTSTTRLIYYADQEVGADLPLHYMVGTPTREEALVQAIDSINPVIGRVHSVLYSPHESGDHADMFHFPLCNGSSWQTMFYGETFTMTATKDGSDRKYTITGTSAEGSTLRIDYDSDVQWFTLIDLDRASGETVTMQLDAVGAGATGDAYFLRGQKDVHGELVAEAPTPAPLTAVDDSVGFTREDGGDGPYDTVGVHLVAGFDGYGTVQVALTAPDGTVAKQYQFDMDGFPVTVDEYFEAPFQTGEWSVGLTMVSASPDAAPEGSVVFDAVSIYDRSCTVGGDCLS